MSRLIGFYETQLRVLWEWRGGRVALLKRLLITLVVATVSFLATAAIFGSRFEVDRVIDGVIAVILMSLFNAAIRPVILALAAPVSLILVAVLVLVLQVVTFLVVAQLAPGVHVGLPDRAPGLVRVRDHQHDPDRDPRRRHAAAPTTGSLVQRLMVKRSQGHTDKPGLVIIQIDGLAHPILAGRMRAGSVNTMAGLVRDGSHKLSKLGGDPAVDDLRQPGRDPARQQRRHPGVPLVRAGPRST